MRFSVFSSEDNEVLCVAEQQTLHGMRECCKLMNVSLSDAVIRRLKNGRPGDFIEVDGVAIVVQTGQVNGDLCVEDVVNEFRAAELDGDKKRVALCLAALRGEIEWADAIWHKKARKSKK